MHSLVLLCKNCCRLVLAKALANQTAIGRKSFLSMARIPQSPRSAFENQQSQDSRLHLGDFGHFLCMARTAEEGNTSRGRCPTPHSSFQ